MMISYNFKNTRFHDESNNKVTNPIKAMGYILEWVSIHLPTCISLAWYITMSPRSIAVERLIRPFSTYEYMDSCQQ